ncbi:antitoxin VapB32 [Actinomycetospora sp. NBRC 106375]|uniref:type II toxin-antitoxin system VapB family antitoxin n=1 Tax=Actinomycetospora sp. NBRC 106375 TaxID=3032207 RepID=UPI0024A604EA|nr:type II toxin-antitoxin system VapB family antitoxin [Actinomycetospora sp. NBRC 106375]GLZ46779.1 antitoxin VapB32 [Actinomycetospora sp. NBRC 106375]
MRTTVTIDDDLVAQATELTGIAERSALLRAGLETLVRVESARRLAALGGTDPDATAAPRRRGEVA